ncbi:DEAD/DEAH box helicase [Spiroplasma endosymbiont of Danaus chrysippus]|uniref:DEAD/DEAH box helicase n=1 Tax=Spiroplasma endosymbiont of Danaus chrysippus TaxID=2691041 RepID=UPI00157B3E82|nr:DEAD/DEAH box helicase [Spiroplasma endosymbiont of Danaus chrysippus]
MSFTELNLKQELTAAIAKWGYTTPTPIQKKTIPVSLQKKDIIGKSHTGSGKTAAFVLPILHNLDIKLYRNQAIIVCPTRELAIQVAKQVKKYAYFLNGVNVALLCGGVNIRNQLYDLRTSNIVVGTPGRITDHINRGSLRLNSIKTLVLDEADEMLKMGFKKDIDFLFENSPQNIQTVLFSATMSKPVLKIADDYQNNPVSITVEDESQKLQQANIKQYYFDCRNITKETALVTLYQKLQPQLSIVFSNTKAFTNKIAQLLEQNNIKCAVINGDKSQRERMEAMRQFKNGKVKVLIATDVVARGIDINGIDYVFNYDIPREYEYYTHRIGRTARAGAQGTAITLVSNRVQYNEIQEIQYYQNHEITLLDTTGWDLPKNVVKVPTKLNFSSHNNRNDFKRNVDNNSKWKRKPKY